MQIVNNFVYLTSITCTTVLSPPWSSCTEQATVYVPAFGKSVLYDEQRAFGLFVAEESVTLCRDELAGLVVKTPNASKLSFAG